MLIIAGFLIICFGILLTLFLSKESGPLKLKKTADTRKAAEGLDKATPSTDTLKVPQLTPATPSVDEKDAQDNKLTDEHIQTSKKAEGDNQATPSVAKARSVLEIPPDPDEEMLKEIILPGFPYSVYFSAYLNLKETKITQRELLHNNLPAYIIPIEVVGDVAQSLFGVSQNGVWYCLLVGHFSTKDGAREMLDKVLEEQPDAHPEIFGFPYALECGRTMDQEKAKTLNGALRENGFFPYIQTYPASNERTLFRTMISCYFSRQFEGAQSKREQLSRKGFSCNMMGR